METAVEKLAVDKVIARAHGVIDTLIQDPTAKIAGVTSHLLGVDPTVPRLLDELPAMLQSYQGAVDALQADIVRVNGRDIVDAFCQIEGHLKRATRTARGENNGSVPAPYRQRGARSLTAPQHSAHDHVTQRWQALKSDLVSYLAPGRFREQGVFPAGRAPASAGQLREWISQMRCAITVSRRALGKATGGSAAQISGILKSLVGSPGSLQFAKQVLQTFGHWDKVAEVVGKGEITPAALLAFGEKQKQYISYEGRVEYWPEGIETLIDSGAINARTSKRLGKVLAQANRSARIAILERMGADREKQLRTFVPAQWLGAVSSEEGGVTSCTATEAKQSVDGPAPCLPARPKKPREPRQPADCKQPPRKEPKREGKTCKEPRDQRKRKRKKRSRPPLSCGPRVQQAQSGGDCIFDREPPTFEPAKMLKPLDEEIDGHITMTEAPQTEAFIPVQQQVATTVCQISRAQRRIEGMQHTKKVLRRDGFLRDGNKVLSELKSARALATSRSKQNFAEVAIAGLRRAYHELRRAPQDGEDAREALLTAQTESQQLIAQYQRLSDTYENDIWPYLLEGIGPRRLGDNIVLETPAFGRVDLRALAYEHRQAYAMLNSVFLLHRLRQFKNGLCLKPFETKLMAREINQYRGRGGDLEFIYALCQQESLLSWVRAARKSREGASMTHALQTVGANLQVGADPWVYRAGLNLDNMRNGEFDVAGANFTLDSLPVQPDFIIEEFEQYLQGAGRTEYLMRSASLMKLVTRAHKLPDERMREIGKAVADDAVVTAGKAALLTSLVHDGAHVLTSDDSVGKSVGAAKVKIGIHEARNQAFLGKAGSAAAAAAAGSAAGAIALGVEHHYAQFDEAIDGWRKTGDKKKPSEEELMYQTLAQYLNEVAPM